MTERRQVHFGKEIASMNKIAKELREAWGKSPTEAGLFLAAAHEIERLEREVNHQRDLVEGYKRIAAQS